MRVSKPVLPATQAALTTLGAQIAAARREAGWTAAELAERLGVTAPVVTKLEKGSPTTTIGTVFEAAVVCGVPLFGAAPHELAGLARAQRDRLALLPARVRTRAQPVSDDF